MRTVTCPRTGIELTLGNLQRLSLHATTEGVVSYYRCTCGGLVVDTPGSLRHSGVLQLAAA